MIPLLQRQTLLGLITTACKSGARLAQACALIGLSLRTIQRWRHPDGQDGDCRTSDKRRSGVAPNKLSEAERQAALDLLNSEEFKDLPPSQIVPRLADQGRYVASESTLYRLLRDAGQLAHRRLERVAQKRSKPRALVARAPDQIYCWDISYLPTEVRGIHFYLYLFVDLFSRKIVGWQVYACESAERASQLLQDICERQGIAPNQLTVHSDNGSPMKGETMLATMQRLGVAASRSRPAVSNDNPYSEALFRTLKYRPQLPVKPFSDLLQARRWVTELVHWYNHEHRHSAISFVTPAQRHAQLDCTLLDGRSNVYATARQAHPNRWSGQTRNWERKESVHLNPDKPEQKKQPVTQQAA
jgi:putative transposase